MRERGAMNSRRNRENVTSNDGIAEKQMELMELLPYLAEVPMFMKFFDTESEKFLDEKIEVLKAIKAGKQIEEIPKFFDVLELMPKEEGKAVMWD